MLFRVQLYEKTSFHDKLTFQNFFFKNFGFNKIYYFAFMIIIEHLKTLTY
jgi:hypothetical protein